MPVRRECKVPDPRRRMTPHTLWFDVSKKSALKEAALSDLAWETSSAQRFPFNHISYKAMTCSDCTRYFGKGQAHDKTFGSLGWARR